MKLCGRLTSWRTSLVRNDTQKNMNLRKISRPSSKSVIFFSHTTRYTHTTLWFVFRVTFRILVSYPNMTSFNFLYASTMALNNMAVSLLHRGHHDEAAAVFPDTLILLREVSESPSTVGCPLPCSSIQDMLDNAAQVLARCHQQPSKCQNESIGTFPVIDHIELVQAARRSLQDDLYLSSAPLVRIELTASSISDRNNYFAGLESSIILYNYGLALLSSSSASLEEGAKQNMARKALRLFDLSFTVLEQHTSQKPDQAVSADNLAFGILVTRMLSFSTWQLEMLTEFRLFYSRMSSLRDTLHYAEASMEDIAAPVAAAAAWFQCVLETLLTLTGRLHKVVSSVRFILLFIVLVLPTFAQCVPRENCMLVEETFFSYLQLTILKPSTRTSSREVSWPLLSAGVLTTRVRSPSSRDVSLHE